MLPTQLSVFPACPIIVWLIWCPICLSNFFSGCIRVKSAIFIKKITKASVYISSMVVHKEINTKFKSMSNVYSLLAWKCACQLQLVSHSHNPRYHARDRTKWSLVFRYITLQSLATYWPKIKTELKLRNTASISKFNQLFNLFCHLDS